jgi:hypothetical protein
MPNFSTKLIRNRLQCTFYCTHAFFCHLWVVVRCLFYVYAEDGIEYVVGVGVYLCRLLSGVACICVLLWCRLLFMNTVCAYIM